MTFKAEHQNTAWYKNYITINVQQIIRFYCLPNPTKSSILVLESLHLLNVGYELRA